MATQVLN